MEDQHAVLGRAACYAAWAAVIQLPPFEEIPPALLNRAPSFGDTLRSVPFVDPCPAPTTQWLDLLPAQCPPQWLLDSLRDVYDLFVHRSWGVAYLLKFSTFGAANTRQLEAFLQDGEGATLFMSEGDSVALSANWLRPAARPYVWDCTAGWDKPPRPKDFHAPVKGRLVSSFFKLHLQHYPDQEILSYFCLGVRYKGMVDMQTFWPPPML